MTQRYICHKIVTAWEQEKDGKPGYSVKYEDGYVSWSPKEAFEAGYTAIGNTEGLPGWHERLLAEGELLANKLEKLTDYLQSEHFDALKGHSPLVAKLMQEQQILMTSYLTVLTQRCELLKA